MANWSVMKRRIPIAGLIFALQIVKTDCFQITTNCFSKTCTKENNLSYYM